MAGTDLKPEQLASLWYSLTANGDDVEAELVTEVVPRVTLRGLDPAFTRRAEGLERMTQLWAIARLKAERHAWIRVSLVQTAFQRLDHAEETREERRTEKAHQQLMA